MKHGSRPRTQDTQSAGTQSVGEVWPEEELCFCKECRIARHEFTLTETSIDEEPASFRASPKFREEGDLEEFLRQESLQSLYSTLREHEVKLSDLHLLTRDDLADMKIPIGPRNRLLSALERSRASSLRQSKGEPAAQAQELELDSPKQHSAPSVKPATPEKPPLGSLSGSENPIQQRRKALNDEVEHFLQEVEELFSRRPRKAVPPPKAASESQQSAVSTDQMAMLKALFDGKDSLERGLMSLSKTVAELRGSRSPRPKDSSARAFADSPKPKEKSQRAK